MRITRNEIFKLLRFMVEVEDEEYSGYSHPWEFFADHPHLLMPMGFDEYVSFSNWNELSKFWLLEPSTDTERAPQSLYRTPTGQWLWLMGVPISRRDPKPPGERGGDLFEFHSKSSLQKDFDAEERTDDILDHIIYQIGGEPALMFSFQDLYRKLESIVDSWETEQKTLWSPQLWTPSAQTRERSLLTTSIGRILLALHEENISLSDVTWQQLEEIVAEILRGLGLEIAIVRGRPQGGRDIVARGQLIPGQEPLTMAVEVKHRPIVGRPDVQAALWQNRYFPALLFVTSGRFTAGVVREKALPENQIRLFLKDGVALGDMIRDYGLAKAARASANWTNR